MFKLKTTKCKCGNNLKTNSWFKVRVKLPNDSWKSKMIDSLDMAKKVEAKFKTQAVEETVDKNVLATTLPKKNVSCYLL